MKLLLIASAVLLSSCKLNGDICAMSEDHWRCDKIKCEELGGLYISGAFSANCVFPPKS